MRYTGTGTMNKIQIIQILEKHRKLLRTNALFNSNEGNVVAEALTEAIEYLK